MAITNLERVGQALEILRDGLAPFVESELKNKIGEKWLSEAKQILERDKIKLRGKPGEINWDVAALLRVMWGQWNEVFSQTLGRSERSLVSELWEIRNLHAHQEKFSSDDAYRALDSASRLLSSISAPEFEKIEKSKNELLRVRYDEQVRQERRKGTGAPIELGIAGGGRLKPWREVVTPHKDVASGKYQQAEFAADLWTVFQGGGSEEYRDPIEFFRRTFITQGIEHLIISAMQRANDIGGDPVVELQTNFGGGKTHTMLALYHLFSGEKTLDLPGMEEVTVKAGVAVAPKMKRVVLVGNKISPGRPERKEDGTTVRTLWGELAYQIGGKQAYGMIKQDDERATNPGAKIGEIIRKFGPCLILIDEWVAYARQLHDGGTGEGLPGGSFETQFTFAQTLTEELKQCPKSMLIVSVPASDSATASPHGTMVEDVEVGGTRGKAALARLKNAIGRVEASWKPAGPDEGFEIVRRRLFAPIDSAQLYKDRDVVAAEFSKMYREQAGDFPSETKEREYERRMKAAYPIHPEVFDRLYNDWSTLAKFQRTRGVLRLMAAVIHSLWKNEDKGLLIMPSSIPIDDQPVHFELTRYLEDRWDPILESDVDGPNSLPRIIDQEQTNLGRLSACRRVARTVYMGSAPIRQAANRGIEELRVRLGCVQVGEPPAVFSDALRYLSRRATYLYQDGSRYWYDTQPTVTKKADEEAEVLKRSPEKILEELRKRCVAEVSSPRNRGQFLKVHVFPAGPSDVTDEMEASLVLLSPESSHGKGEGSKAVAEANRIMEKRGTQPRLNRNALMFLASDEGKWSDLEESIRRYLAWSGIVDKVKELNLDRFQENQAKAQLEQADKSVAARIPEVFCHLLVPSQEDAKGAISLKSIRLTGEGLAARASKKLKAEGLLYDEMAAIYLRQEIDKIPLWKGDDLGLKELISYYFQYPYLSRVTAPEVLINAVREGISNSSWEKETFAYASGKDPKTGRYLGLLGGKMGSVIQDGASLLVKSEVAAKQIEDDKPKEPTSSGGTQSGGTAPGGGAGGGSGVGIQPPPYDPPTKKILPKKYFGSVRLDPSRVGPDAAKIAMEVIQHLALEPGAEVEVSMEINATIPGGTPENVQRTVRENARTLKFKVSDFEVG